MSHSPNVVIYDYSHVVDYLNAVLNHIKKDNPSYSLRAWTKRLGVSDPGTISRILSGRRRIPKSLLHKISQSLELNTKQTAYFELIASGPYEFSKPTLEYLIRAAKSNE